jgi:hypothetical protein
MLKEKSEKRRGIDGKVLALRGLLVMKNFMNINAT